MGSSQKRKMIRFFFGVFDTLKNNTSKGKGKAKYNELGGGKKEKRKKKTEDALLLFTLATLEIVFARK